MDITSKPSDRLPPAPLVVADVPFLQALEVRNRLEGPHARVIVPRRPFYDVVEGVHQQMGCGVALVGRRSLLVIEVKA